MSTLPPDSREKLSGWLIRLQDLASKPTGQVIRDALTDLLPFACFVSALAVIGTVLGMIPGADSHFGMPLAPLFNVLETSPASIKYLPLAREIREGTKILGGLDIVPFYVPYLIGSMLMPAAFAMTSALRFADRYHLRERLALALSAFLITLLLTWGPIATLPFVEGVDVPRLGLFHGLFQWGLLGGLAVGLGIVVLHRALNKAGMGITLPLTVPHRIAGPYRVLTPAILTLFIGLAIVLVIGWRFTPLLEQSGRLAALALEQPLLLLAAVLLMHVLIFFGVQNYSAIVGWVWLAYLLAGLQGVLPYLGDASGALAPPPITLSAVFYGVLLGGVGATLGLNIFLFYCRAVSLRTLAAWALPGSLFNTNELLVYGLPIPYSQPFLTPFLVAPMVLAVTTWVAFNFGLVDPPQLLFPPFVPAPLGLWLATGDWRSLILIAVNGVIATLIYAPFVRRYDEAVANLEEGLDPDLPSWRQPRLGHDRPKM